MPLDDPGDSGHEPVQRDFKLDAPAEVVVPLQAVAQFDEEVEAAIPVIVINNRALYPLQFCDFTRDFRCLVALGLRRHQQISVTAF
jgi:hypothetical protein